MISFSCSLYDEQGLVSVFLLPNQNPQAPSSIPTSQHSGDNSILYWLTWYLVSVFLKPSNQLSGIFCSFSSVWLWRPSPTEECPSVLWHQWEGSKDCRILFHAELNPVFFLYTHGLPNSPNRWDSRVCSLLPTVRWERKQCETELCYMSD